MTQSGGSQLGYLAAPGDKPCLGLLHAPASCSMKDVCMHLLLFFLEAIIADDGGTYRIESTNNGK